VPKRDELTALEMAFDLKLQRSDGLLSDRYQFWLRSIGTLPRTNPLSAALPSVNARLLIALMNEQTTTVAALVTQQVLTAFSPAVIVLFGTAAGRGQGEPLGHVIISECVIDATQQKALPGDRLFRRHDFHTPSKIRADVQAHLAGPDEWLRDLLRRVDLMTERLGVSVLQPVEDRRQWLPEHKYVVSTDTLYQDPQARDQLCRLDDRIRCIDMEGGGFARACDEAPYSPQWVVLRGISDVATVESKQEGVRTASVLPAATYLQPFLATGLLEAHPNSIRVEPSLRTAPSSVSLFSRFEASDYVSREVARRLEIDVSDLKIGPSVSLSDLEAICVSRGAVRERAHDILGEIREDYFTTKYRYYDYGESIRGAVPVWRDDFRFALSILALDLAGKRVLDVGIGNGLEIDLFASEGIRSITGLDVSEKLLQVARSRMPELLTVHAAAEDMAEIATGSIDVYVSLRTYQSSLLDVSQALREAQRVLAANGSAIISIASGYVDRSSSVVRIVRGLMPPGGGPADALLPLRLGGRILEKMTDLGFIDTGLLMGRTDVYLWARKANSYSQRQEVSESG
jgi:nucleoside phosphorylase/SAM-dependent methyltransferase